MMTELLSELQAIANELSRCRALICSVEDVPLLAKRLSLYSSPGGRVKVDDVGCMMDDILKDLVATLPTAKLVEPVDLVLYCPACLTQHIDDPVHEKVKPGDSTGAMAAAWFGTSAPKAVRRVFGNDKVPLHISHVCTNPDCKHQWRPADVPTRGVHSTKTHDAKDMVMFDGPAAEMESLRMNLMAYKTAYEALEQKVASSKGVPPATQGDDSDHDLYIDADDDKPNAICDRNGQVVLGLCKKCGKGEVELEGPCVPKEVIRLSVTPVLENHTKRED